MTLRDRISKERPVGPGSVFQRDIYVMRNDGGEIVGEASWKTAEETRISRSAPGGIWVTGRATLQLMRRRDELSEAMVALDMASAKPQTVAQEVGKE